jgi:hypothetical protein
MSGELLATAAPHFARELVQGLRAIGCHELAQELPSLVVGRWRCDAQTGALAIQLLGPERDPAQDAIVATGYGRSLPLRLRGTVLLELDDFGRVYGLELFDRDDVLRELHGHAR